MIKTWVNEEAQHVPIWDGGTITTTREYLRLVKLTVSRVLSAANKYDYTMKLYVKKSRGDLFKAIKESNKEKGCKAKWLEAVDYVSEIFLRMDGQDSLKDEMRKTKQSQREEVTVFNRQF